MKEYVRDEIGVLRNCGYDDINGPLRINSTVQIMYTQYTQKVI